MQIFITYSIPEKLHDLSPYYCPYDRCVMLNVSFALTIFLLENMYETKPPVRSFQEDRRINFHWFSSTLGVPKFFFVFYDSTTLIIFKLRCRSTDLIEILFLIPNDHLEMIAMEVSGTMGLFTYITSNYKRKIGTNVVDRYRWCFKIHAWSIARDWKNQTANLFSPFNFVEFGWSSRLLCWGISFIKRCYFKN